MRVLVTGATGYVGSRLVPELIGRGHEVLAAVRSPGDADDYPWSSAVGERIFDVEDDDAVASAVAGVDAVVYLVHLMAGDDFVTKDREAAQRVAHACEQAGVGRLTYLSGLVPEGELSDHLRSRLEVEQVFLDSTVPATVLRAAMVVGAGSISFDLMRRTTERLAVMPIPRWMDRTLQPVAVEDIVHLIANSLDREPRDRAYDVGGDDVVGYPQLIALFARVAGLRRFKVVVPFAPRWLVGRVLALVTGLPRSTVTALTESLSHDMVCREDDVRRDLADPGHEFLPLEEALRRAVAPRADATRRTGDVQAAAPTDAA